jgi:MFS family permease
MPSVGEARYVAPTEQSSWIPDKRWRRDRRFFTGMAIAAAVSAFVGFYPTYYLKPFYGTPALPPLVHLHGILFTGWIILLITQTSLVAIRRTDLHRRLGVGGAALAGLMTVVGYFTAIGALHRGTMNAQFLVVPLASVVVFPVLVGAALMLRRKPEAHKRLIWIATTDF